jgi:hypothetical protein
MRHLRPPLNEPVVGRADRSIVGNAHAEYPQTAVVGVQQTLYLGRTTSITRHAYRLGLIAAKRAKPHYRAWQFSRLLKVIAAPAIEQGERRKHMLLILLVIVLLLSVGSYPSWPHSRNWGYYPSGGLGLVVVILLVLLLMGRL